MILHCYYLMQITANYFTSQNIPTGIKQRVIFDNRQHVVKSLCGRKNENQHVFVYQSSGIFLEQIL